MPEEKNRGKVHYIAKRQGEERKKEIWSRGIKERASRVVGGFSSVLVKLHGSYSPM